MLLALVLLPVVAGFAVWASRARARAVLGGVAAATMVTTFGVAVWAIVSQPSIELRWGAGLTLGLGVGGMARLPIVLVPLVGLAVTVYAAAHEHRDGLVRLVALLMAFVGAMELLLLATDFLTLLIAWELVGAISWALIAHEWRTDAPSLAAHAFNATRFGDLGLFIAAGAVFAATGSLSFDAAVDVSGSAATALVAGVLVAALAKSAQVPFAPWLFSAMAGPTSVSAMLHAATMVAAGAYLLARLHPALDAVPWFAPTAIAAGLVTAVGGGVVAALQSDVKKLLAASTSAHYGLMIVAVGAGYPAVAMIHLVAHGLFKALLFLSSGIAIEAAGSRDLARMGVGRPLRASAWLAGLGSLALAAVPPFGGAWTKEQIVAAATHANPAVGWLVIVAGALSAFYAARFQLLVFGAPRDRRAPVARRPGWAEHGPVGLLGVAGLTLGLLWTPAGSRLARDLIEGRLPVTTPWELVASLLTIAIAAYGALAAYRRRRLAWLTTTPATQLVADWFGLAALTRVVVVEPALTLARVAGRFDDVVFDGAARGVAAAGRGAARIFGAGDDHVVDAGVRRVAALAAWTSRMSDRIAELGFDGAVEGIARMIGAAARDSQRMQTGQLHHYYAIIAIWTAVLVIVIAL